MMQSHIVTKFQSLSIDVILELGVICQFNM